MKKNTLALILSQIAMSTAISAHANVTCNHKIVNQWNSGFQAEITLTNNGNQAVNGWNVEWEYVDGSYIQQTWNATRSNSIPHEARNMDYNARIPAGGSQSFGLTGVKGQFNGQAPNARFTGGTCNNSQSSQTSNTQQQQNNQQQQENQQQQTNQQQQENQQQQTNQQQQENQQQQTNQQQQENQQQQTNNNTTTNQNTSNSNSDNVISTFPGGRIAISADGNAHDKDDWGATALVFAMLDAAGLNDEVVHVDYNNNLCLNDSRWEKEMIETVIGGAERFGFDKSVMFNDQDNVNGSTKNLAAAINASSNDNPLWILAQGPMETVFRGINAAEKSKRKFVKVISHSGWNEKRDKFHNDYNGRNCGLNNNWKKMVNKFKPDGVIFYDSGFILDQNSTQNNGNDGDWNSPDSKWNWLKNSDNPDWRWLFNRDDKNGFDVSDAGMAYWLISGGPNGGCKTCGANEAKQLLENPVSGSNSNTTNSNTTSNTTNTSSNDTEKGVTYSEKNGFVIMEMENTASAYDKWKLKSNIAGYKGKGHLEFTGNNQSSGPATSPLKYQFKINQSGQYRIMLRGHKRLDGAASDKSNDAYVRVEGQYDAAPGAGNNHNDPAKLTDLKRNVKLFGGAANGWGWAELLDLGGHDNKRKPIYVFSAGETYTLVISGRSKNFNVDRIVFYRLADHSTSNAKSQSGNLAETK